ncbi:MAG: DUF3052 domain-containing protein [Pseudomonadota bacterium]
MAPTTAGYSGKPLFQKLGIKPGMRCKPMLAPAHYGELLTGIEGATVSSRLRSADVVHLFCRTKSVLVKQIDAALARVVPGGMLWISWPKKSSPLYKDLTEDDLRTIVLPLGWVDVKVCAVDNDWSGLKFMRRKQ